MERGEWYGRWVLCLGGNYVMKVGSRIVRGEENRGVFEVLRSRILSSDIIMEI
ncbi:hypothetical protein TIFTF001_020154 [Ficus carica]|uniref:Uncharacterized protein n=1 Tax=Ficus carica TaxID=3494 RepID=A0AA88AEC9_FICCA|nr:hypothetical protein TIFTF001_020154 [Ficus carica]